MIVILISFSSIEDIKHFLGRHMDSLWSNLAIEHSVEDSNVGKCSSRHNQVISSPCSICIEVLLLNALCLEEAGSGGIACNVSSRRDVISRN